MAKSPAAILYKRLPLPGCDSCPLHTSTAVQNGASIRSFCRGYSPGKRLCGLAQAAYRSAMKEPKDDVPESLRNEFAVTCGHLRYLNVAVFAFGLTNGDGTMTKVARERVQIARHFLALSRACGIAKGSVKAAAEKYDTALFGTDKE